MKKEYFYRVASHLFRIVTDGSLIPHQEIYGFKPFVLSEEDAKKQAGYIALLAVTKNVLEACIDMLGFEAPERM